MGYEELFPPWNMKWAENATKRFASPFVDKPHDRIDVDAIILSHAAVSCGYTIRDFYEKPELGIHCVGYANEMFDLLPVTHWFFSLPWVTELGIRYHLAADGISLTLIVLTGRGLHLGEIGEGGA